MKSAATRGRSQVHMPHPIDAKALIKELHFANFIKDKKELANITEKCRGVLAAQEEKQSYPAEHIDAALSFVQAIWEKYDCKEIADI